MMMAEPRQTGGKWMWRIKKVDDDENWIEFDFDNFFILLYDVTTYVDISKVQYLVSWRDSSHWRLLRWRRLSSHFWRFLAKQLNWIVLWNVNKISEKFSSCPLLVFILCFFFGIFYFISFFSFFSLFLLPGFIFDASLTTALQHARWSLRALWERVNIEF